MENLAERVIQTAQGSSQNISEKFRADQVVELINDEDASVYFNHRKGTSFGEAEVGKYEKPRGNKMYFIGLTLPGLGSIEQDVDRKGLYSFLGILNQYDFEIDF
jgi:hypothetical protein